MVSINNFLLEKIINKKLNSSSIKDYILNGLQIEGKTKVANIILGVSACQKVLDSAVKKKADAIIVHHGYFWKNESPQIQGIKKKRIKTLLEHNLNLYAWHLPLDVHPTLGNNAQLAILLNIQVIGILNRLVLWGTLNDSLSGKQFKKKIEKKIKNSVFYLSNNEDRMVKTVAWCTGNGQKFIDLIPKTGIDAFISGEISENTFHFVRETGIHFYAAGHHATERKGIQALGKWLLKSYGLQTKYVDVSNPI